MLESVAGVRGLRGRHARLRGALDPRRRSARPAGRPLPEGASGDRRPHRGPRRRRRGRRDGARRAVRARADRAAAPPRRAGGADARAPGDRRGVPAADPAPGPRAAAGGEAARHAAGHDPRGLSTRDLLDRALATRRRRAGHRGGDVATGGDRAAGARRRGDLVPARGPREVARAPRARWWPGWCRR